MSNCNKCGKQFHACPSCGLMHDWEYNFCSEYCWETSDEFNNFKNLIINFNNSLNKQQKEIFKKIFDEFDSDYEFYIDEWIKI